MTGLEGSSVMNVLRGGRQLFASIDSARQSYANLARIWAVEPCGPGVPARPLIDLAAAA